MTETLLERAILNAFIDSTWITEPRSLYIFCKFSINNFYFPSFPLAFIHLSFLRSNTYRYCITVSVLFSLALVTTEYFSWNLICFLFLI